jgi:DNA polymerase-3 subunit alpha
VSEGRILYALGALKNVGAEAMRLIVEARRGEGGEKPFATLYDFARRVDLKRVGKRPLEMLARSGAFDALDRNRHRVLRALDALVAYSAAIHEQKGSAQVSLFGEAGEDLPEPRLPDAEDWMPAARLAEEHHALWLLLLRPPARRLHVRAQAQGCAQLRGGGGTRPARRFRHLDGGRRVHRQERKSQRGTRFAFVGLSDPTGTYEVMLFSEALEASRHILEPGTNVRVQVKVETQEGQVRLRGRGGATGR